MKGSTKDPIIIHPAPRASRKAKSRGGPNRPGPGWSVVVWVTVFVAVMAFQAYADQQRPGMPFIAKKACKAPILETILMGQIPDVIPQVLTLPDSTGQITTYQPGGPTVTAGNGFFSTAITTNKRTCFTCHQPQNDWEISPPQILIEYLSTGGNSALFQPIDAAVCPNARGATAKPTSPSFVAARSQLFTRGNFRIAINAPNPLGPRNSSYTTFDGNKSPEWVLKLDYDPYGCETDHVYGLYANQLSVYRRPLNSANVTFLVQDPGFYQNTGGIPPEERQDIMWDAREPDLYTQFIDATEFHGQTTVPPGIDSITQGILFQSGLFTAQSYDNDAGDLTGSDGTAVEGGPVNLYNSIPSRAGNNFVLGQDTACLNFNPALQPFPGLGLTNPPQPLGAVNQLVCPGDPAVIPPNNLVTQLFTGFANPQTGNCKQKAQRQSIARGEAIFNGQSLQFNITNVAGLNDIVGANPAQGSCSFCHNNTNVVNDGFGDPKRLGIMDNSSNVLPPTPDFPRFAFYCASGTVTFFSNPVKSANCPGSMPGKPATCDKFVTTDPGKGLITGKCADLGKMKVPILRGVGSRAPYFHGGNAATLLDAVNFYNKRFNIGLTAQQKTDLINYLNSL